MVIGKVEKFEPPTHKEEIKKEKKEIKKGKVKDKLKQEGLLYSNITNTKRVKKPNRKYL